jgi:hypothetical protein
MQIVKPVVRSVAKLESCIALPDQALGDLRTRWLAESNSA